MPEYLTPGVYVEEIEIGAKTIEGVSTSTAGFLGETERGPTTPRLVTSWLEYQKIFGSYFGEDKYLPFSVKGFFQNGGQSCYIARIVKTDATKATKSLPSGDGGSLNIEAIGEGEWGNRIVVKVSKATRKGDLFKLSVFYWKNLPEKLYDPETDLKTPTRPVDMEVFDNISLDKKSTDYYETKVNQISNFIKILPNQEKIPKIPLEISGKVTAEGTPTGSFTSVNIDTEPTDEFKEMQIAFIDSNGKSQISTIRDIVITSKTVKVDVLKEMPNKTYKYFIFQVKHLEGGADSVLVDSLKVNTIDKLTIKLDEDPSNTDISNKYVEVTEGKGKGQTKLIEKYENKVITLKEGWNQGSEPDKNSQYRIVDKNPTLELPDYETTAMEDNRNKGLLSFEKIEEIAIIYSPNALRTDGLAGSLITHCEKMKYRFAIIDAKPSSSEIGNLSPRDDNDTKYAAFYYPWIKVVDPDAGFLKLIPPGGHVAGVYARSDANRGVFKAPANEVVNEAAELEFQITKEDQRSLNPKGVNVIRAFPGRGIRIWGARTLSSDPLWKYINVRRLFIFLEHSIDNGTQWVVFEPNDEKLWDRVKQTINQFLTQVWRDGALMGATAEEAFFVKCDRTTMTQNDIDNGRLIVMIGVAPVKPAEFVIFRIAQWTAGAKS